MRDDFLSRDWAEGHRSFTAGFAALIESISIGLARLNAKQFDAPWKRDSHVRCG